MILIRICFFMAALLAADLASSQEDTVEGETRLDYEEVLLADVLGDLSDRYGFAFSYGQLPLDQTITFSFEGEIQKGIQALFAHVGLVYRIHGDRIVLRKSAPIGRPLRGRVVDADSQLPLIGASVQILNTSPSSGGSTDAHGLFRFGVLPVGRYDLVVSYLGYEHAFLNQILVTTGKDQFIEIALQPSAFAMQEIVVASAYDPASTLNEMSTNSARSFSIEEASRFAAAISDPARMALSYAGVTGNGDDLSNEIIIRGNSSRGLLWRMEGVEIPNPNHFSDLGGTAGNISMLSSSTLTNSDFYTGAFTAEFGNALSGVFDLHMRNGNWEKREHKLQIGSLGLEASSEGYLKKGSQASYLLNYRYSTVDLVERLLPSLPTQVDPFQDLSFKINVPSRKWGTFTLFGLGGKNSTAGGMLADTSNFQFKWQLQDFFVRQNMFVVGLVHKYILSDKSYLRTSISTSKYGYSDVTNELQPEKAFASEVIDQTSFSHKEMQGSILYQNKLDNQTTLRAGLNVRRKSFIYDYISVADADRLTSFLDHSGSTTFSDIYVQINSKIDAKWSLQAGLNASYLALNGTYGIDPRVGLVYQQNSNRTWAISTGLYSKPDHISTYFIERKDINGVSNFPNLNLPMLKAWHLVLSHDWMLSNRRRLKIETYYQHLFDIPVGVDSSRIFSVLNASTAFGVIFLNDADGALMVPEGSGNNYGLELTFEKFFSEGFYFLLTGSLFDSHFSTGGGRSFPTRYATNFATNYLMGKEWAVGLRKKNAFSLNGKLVWVGGLRTTPILLEESIKSNETIIDIEQYNSNRLPSYFRFDVGAHYRINMDKTTHTFSIECQNLTNRRNAESIFYDPLKMSRVTSRQNGIIPFLNYRMEF